MMRKGPGVPFVMFCGLLLLLPMGIISSNDIIEQGPGSIDLGDDALKETMIEKAMSLSTSYFIQNKGQIDSSEIMFYSVGGNIYFTPTGVIYRFREMESIQDVINQDNIPDPTRDVPEAYHEWGVVLKYSFIGANLVIPEGCDRCSWNTNYFKGSDPSKWYTEVPNYFDVVYPDLWDGIDLVYRLKDGAIKYDLIIHPGADPSRIGFRIDGNTDLDVNEKGDLVISTEFCDILDTGLVAEYSDGQEEDVTCIFKITGPGTFGFNLGPYDRSREAVIDPSLTYSTFLGGPSAEYAAGIVIDTSGNAYITGETDEVTTDYPTTSGAYDTSHNGGCDVFVTKLNFAGSSLVYSTFIGGSGEDQGHAIAIDMSGNAYITGYTTDDTTDYPTTSGAYDTSYNGESDVFITKLNSIGSSLVYSTLIGGSSFELGHGISIDSSGNAYITGWTYDTITDYPTTSGAYDTSHNGQYDAFVTKLNSDGMSLTYSTFIGGSNNEEGVSIDIDSSGNAYITGWTEDATTDYPTTSGAYDTSHNGQYDVFVTKLNLAGSSLIYSTFIGGSDDDVVGGIALDCTGNAYITGYTFNDTTNYPTTSGVYDTSHNGDADVFVTKLNSIGSSLVYSTFLGGASADVGIGISIDLIGNVYITGITFNDIEDYPTTSGAYDTSHNGDADVFVTKLNSSGSSMVYSTFIGGSDYDRCYGSAIDPSGNIYVTGITLDATIEYPTTLGAYDTSYNGFIDVFVTKLDLVSPVFNSDKTINKTTTGDQFIFNITVSDNTEVSSVFVEYRFGDGTSTNIRMSRTNPYIYKITIPSNSIEELHYIFHAKDTSDNWNQTEEKIVTVVDNDPPSLSVYDPPKYLGTGDLFERGVTAYDNIGISAVRFEYWFGEGLHDNDTLVSDDYRIRLMIPEGSLDPLHYIISAVDISGNWASIQGTIVVEDTLPPIVVRPLDMVVDEDRQVTFNGSSSHDNIGIVNWTWSFFDGTDVVLHGSETDYVFEEPGNYTVYLTVTDGTGQWDMKKFNVLVNDVTPPTVIIGPMEVNEDTFATFNTSSCLDNVGIVNYTWTFVDGMAVTLFGVIPTYRFQDPGVFVVTLNVTDAGGNWRTDTMTVTVKDITPPVAIAGENLTVPAGKIVILDGSGSTDNGMIENHTWTISYGGEDQVLEGINISFKFDIAGSYEVTLSVVDLNGNVGIDTLTITVVDRGTVTGVVLDRNGYPVKDAVVLIEASDGEDYTALTSADGSFSVEVPQGPIKWTISKEGYETISGIASVTALETTVLDLSNTPLEKESKERSMLPIIIIAIIFLVMTLVAIALFLFFKGKKEASMIVEEKSEEVVIQPESTPTEPIPEASIPTPEPSEPTPQPPVKDEAPTEEEVDETPKEDTLVDPGHLEDPGSSL